MRLHLLAAPDGTPRAAILAPADHNTRTLHGLRARIATKLLALAARVRLNHYLNRPTRAFADLSH